MDCPELDKLIAGIEGNIVPVKVRQLFEAHLEECRTCQAALNKFLQIERILEKTVYGDPHKDHYLAYLSHLTGRKMRWETAEEAKKSSRVNIRRLLIKISAGFFIAAAAGASAVLILSSLGIIGEFGAGKKSITTSPTAQETPRPDSVPAGPAKPIPSEAVIPSAPTAEGEQSQGVTPQDIFKKLNLGEEPPEMQAITAGEKADSAKLWSLEAELSALRDALSRTPGDHSLIKRSMDKYRQVIAERKSLGRPSRVKDYYNLGYLHYIIEEYPQTATVAGEGLRVVRMGPTQYLHYIKAMSHYQIALKAGTPLPPDSSLDETARVRGAALRAELDIEGRKRAVIELRRSITEFSYLLKNPELQQTAQGWILRCNELIGELGSE
ncbi:MAG TPA: hypothetical protein VM123_08430 [archaeon]|nr:hypothetical protein [archaeon]